MALDIAAARAAGYTDAEIAAYEAENKTQSTPSQPPVAGDQPPPPSTSVPEISHGLVSVAQLQAMLLMLLKIMPYHWVKHILVTKHFQNLLAKWAKLGAEFLMHLYHQGKFMFHHKQVEFQDQVLL